MGISIPQLLIILAILVLLFGTKRLRNIGSDLGDAIKGFRKAMDSNEEAKDQPAELEKKDADFDLNGDLKSEVKNTAEVTQTKESGQDKK